MMARQLFENTDFYTAFPDQDAVFESEKEKDFLVPIGLLSKNYFDSSIDNDVLIAIPIEAVDGLIGESTFEHHTPTCCENWLSYSFINGKWKLDCDERYFLGSDKQVDWVQESYAQSKAHYAEAKDYFLKQKELVLLSSRDENPPKQPLIELGGDAFALANWYSYVGNMPHRIVEKMARIAPSEPEEMLETVVMLNSDNQEYRYLGCVWSYLYINPQTAWVHFFYDPQQKRMLMTFDYS